MNRHSVLWFGAFAVAMCAATSATTAQEGTYGTSSQGPSQPLSGGWTVTPTMLYSGNWDDNVLVRGEGDETAGDFVNVLNPRVQVDFNGRRGQLNGSYDGAFVLYRDLNTLNSYDQHGAFRGRRLLSPRLALVVQNTAAAMPTTDLAALVGIPFTRTGSKIDDLQSGIEWALTKRTSLTATYHFSWVQFDDNAEFSTWLRGGHSNGGSLVFRRRLSARATLTADYDMTHADFDDRTQVFDVQNSAGGLEYKLSDAVRVVGAVGLAHLSISDLGPTRTGPVYRAGLSRQFRTAALDVFFSRSFVPTYGFGGTTQNKELTTRLHLSLSRRLFSNSSFSWRSNDSLILAEPSLKTWWLEQSIGYEVQPWMRIEGFYAGSRQTLDRPGGLSNRNRVGFQVITVKPVRIR